MAEPKRRIGCGAFLLAGLVIAGVAVAVGQIADPAAVAPATETGATEPAKPVEHPDAAGWRYDVKVDPMYDRPTHLACVRSEDPVRLGWPYGSPRAELCLRDSPRHGRDAYIQLVGDGQFICRSYDNCTVKVRFDEGGVQSFGATEAADGSSNIVFLTNYGRFVGAVKKADVTIIAATFYQAGEQNMEFDTAGLVWPRPADG